MWGTTEINLERRSSCSSGERVKVFTQPFYHCQSPQGPFPVFCTAASQPRSLPCALTLSQSQSFFVSLPSFYHSKALCVWTSPLLLCVTFICSSSSYLPPASLTPVFFLPFFFDGHSAFSHLSPFSHSLLLLLCVLVYFL